MKLIFIGLLIAAAGVGVYYYVNKTHTKSTKNLSQVLTGVWKVDSLKIKSKWALSFGNGAPGLGTDSSLRQFDFDFKKNGLVLQTRNGIVNDSSRYRLQDSAHMMIWNGDDTTKFQILLSSDADQMTLESDSISFYFRRSK